MLADEASGQGPGTLAGRLSRCKEAMARVFAVRAQIAGSIRVSGYNFNRKQATSQDIQIFITGSGAVAV